MIEALIFDMDGLMFDTERFYMDLFYANCKRDAFTFPKEVYYSLVGTSLVDLNKVEEKYPGFLAVDAKTKKQVPLAYYEVFKHPGDANKKGLRTLLEYAQTHGYKLAIASSSAYPVIQRNLDYMGFAAHFDAIVSGKDEGLKSKPDPMIFMYAAKLLDKDPSKCLVLEDSRNGTMAAHAANMPHVFIQDLVAKDEALLPYLDQECQDLSEVVQLLENQALFWKS